MPLPALDHLLIETAVRAALADDFGRAGDITSQAIIPAVAHASAVIAARQTAGVLSGIDLAKKAFELIDPAPTFKALASDGDRLSPGAIVARIEGSARGILSAERVALNFLGRLCGLATLTSIYAAAVAGTKAKVCCTRKTTPGLRAFEKYAVRCGGGMNHRFGLRRRRADQGQPHRRGRRRRPSLARGQSLRRTSGEGRDRGGHARSVA